MSCQCAREGRSCVDCLNTDNCRNPHNLVQEVDLNVDVTQNRDNTGENIRGRVEWMWGSRKGSEINMEISSIYNEIVHWRRNIFMPPNGAQTKKYIKESTRLILEWVNDSPCSAISLKALFCMPQLLLQKPFASSKSRDHNTALERRLRLWEEGRFDELVSEARCIQQRMKTVHYSRREISEISQKFTSFMHRGKVAAALKLLDKNAKGSAMPLDENTLRLLKQKHPIARPTIDSSLLKGPIDQTNPIIFEKIDGALIRKIATNVEGSAGPSGLDSDGWRRILSNRSFGTTSSDLCKAIAEMTKKLCTKSVKDVQDNTSSIAPFIACRLIPIDKDPGIRPIGIGEVLRRIIGKTTMTIINQDVKNAAGSMQLCAGQKAGGEAAIHSMRNIFECESTEAILLVDASNAFNSLNRKCMLHNISLLCPTLSIYASNCYGTPARLFIVGGGEILSSEGTTQGDPISVAIYAIGINPMLSSSRSEYNTHSVKQVAFADDLSGAGKLDDLKKWWRYLIALGPSYGYFPNPSKSWLIVKNNLLVNAQNIFADTEIKVTDEGERHLGAAIGSAEYKKSYIDSKVEEWVAQLSLLSDIADIDPHSSFSAFFHGLRHKWTYLMRTIPNISKLLEPLETMIRNKFIPAIFGRTCSDNIREILSLPPKLGGIGLINPKAVSDLEFQNSTKLTDSLTKLIMNQNHALLIDENELKSLTSGISKNREKKQIEKLKAIKENLPSRDIKANDLCRENGASNWLTALPLKEAGFNLNKEEFRDSMALRYGFQINGLPNLCICGSSFTIDHAMICKRGGFITHRHNEIRNITGDLLKEVCLDVELEPQLIQLTNEEFLLRSANSAEDARVDVSARNFWIRGQRAFFDVRVFYPFAPSYLSKSVVQIHQLHEAEKRRSYSERILQVEMGSFTPLIFSTSGGMGPEANLFYSKLAGMVAEKRNQPKSLVTAWLRCSIGFSLLRSALLCIRGSRSVVNNVKTNDIDIDVVVAQSRIN